MDFIPLHLNSGYSFLQSGILFNKLSKKLNELNYKYVGLTDLNVLFGFPSFNEEMIKNNIKPIFGMDLKINNNLFSLFVQNETGYRNLCVISTFLEKRDGICNDFTEIKDFLNGLICVISTKSSSVFKHVNQDLFEKYIKDISSKFNNFYIGLEIYDSFDISKANLIREFASSYKIKCIAYPTIKYINKEDYLTLGILKSISEDTGIETIIDEIPRNYYLKTDDEIKLLYQENEVLELTNLVNLIDFEFNTKRGELLQFSEDETISSKDLLKQKILEGLKQHKINLKEKPNYRARLNKEFLIIDKMGYCDYFLIVQDYVNFARKNNIPVGPGRGSAAGSLVSYLLNITEIDPLKFDDLLFERFLNPNRKSMPDIDIDFSDQERDKVIEYIINKYGTDRTARVIAFQTIGAKQALRDVGRVFHYPQIDIDQLSKSIPNNFNQNNYDLDLCAEKIPAFKNLIKDKRNYEIFERAKLIEGFPRQKGLHAAGIIINNKNLINVMPLTPLDFTSFTTQYEKDFLEKQGFLKMDLLGLTALSTIQRTLTLIKHYKNIDIKMSDIPYDDPKSFELLRNQLTMGIFQLDTSAAKKGISYVKPSAFKDVVDLLALDRPGPMEQIPLYSLRKEGKAGVSYLDKSLIPILKNTYGIIIYQEQIMQIARVFAGFSLAEADIFRRAVSKKHKDELMKLKEDFFKKAKEKGHSETTIENIFNLILKFASYGFNKSHSVAYSMISMRMAYLKAYFPLEFYCSILESQYGNNDAKFSKYVTEIKKMKINIEIPDINKSSLNFLIDDNALLMPLANISGMPSKVSISIINERNAHGKFKSFLDFIIRMLNTPDKITEMQINKLIDAGCFDNLNSNRTQLRASVQSALQFASNCILKEGSLFENFGLSYNYVEIENDRKDNLKREYNVLGVAISDNPFNHLKIPRNMNITPFQDLSNNKQYTVLGIIKNIKVISIKNGAHKGEPMAFLDIYDDNDDSLSITLFSSLYAIYQHVLKIDKPIICKGKFEDRGNGKTSLIADELIFIEEE